MGGGGGGGGICQTFSFCSLFPVQQTTSGISHRVKSFFRVGNPYAEYEKQKCSEGLDAFRFFSKQHYTEEQLYPPKPFDCSGGLAAFRFS